MRDARRVEMAAGLAGGDLWDARSAHDNVRDILEGARGWPRCGRVFCDESQTDSGEQRLWRGFLIVC